LNDAEPAFVLGEGWQETFPDLAAAPARDVWRQAWRAWCQPRGLPAGEVEACVLERQDHRLRVVPTPRLLERLRADRSEALRGEAWLLAGSGVLRSAAQIEIAGSRE